MSSSPARLLPFPSREREAAAEAAPATTVPRTAVPMLEVDAVTHRYGERPTLERFSLAVPAGSICCLLGASGCGKSTLLRCVAGFERVEFGAIRIDGETVADRARHVPPEKRRIGMVFQDYALFPHLTVERNVAFGLGRATDARTTARRWLDAVGLEALADRFPHELSGGQQQRVALARALAPRPRLVLLDEPFSNLDVELREQLAGDVRAILKRSGATALFVTHDQNEAFALADEIAVLADGRVQQLDSAFNLYHRPATRYVADFIGQGVFVPGVVLDAHTVRIELGDVASASALAIGPGRAVEVLLRPDDVVHDDASPLRAVVLHKAFRGAGILYTLQLPSGARVLSMVPSHHDHETGQPIGIRLDMDHVIAFEAG